jgi:Fe-S-cluster containining protein
MSSNSKPPFYSRGLRFTCHQCHNCCRGGQPGGVYPSHREVERIARWFEMTAHAFRRRYLVRDADGNPGLRMRPKGDCIFWEEDCTIYPVRPRQCRTFPFWPENLKSPEAWAAVRETCQGAGRGKLRRPEDIRAILHGRST